MIFFWTICEISALTLIGMSYESKKNAHLQRHLGKFYLNFQLQICLEIFDKSSAYKIQSKNHKRDKSTLPHAN